MYWLVLIFVYGSPAMVTIPEKYSDLSQCQSAGMKAEVRHICVKASDAVTLAPTPQYPGYYCGQYPEKCYIDNPEMHKPVIDMSNCSQTGNNPIVCR